LLTLFLQVASVWKGLLSK